MRKQLSRSYITHALVGAILAPLVALLIIAMTYALAALFAPLMPGLLLTLMLIAPMTIGFFMYELRRWMAREAFSLRSLFVYGITSATSVLWVFLILFVFSRLMILTRIRIAPSDWLAGVAGQVIPISLVGACVGVACLVIDNKR